MSRTQSVHAVGQSPIYGEHNMGFRHLTSGDVGRIQPVCVQECVEGDVVNLNMAEAVVTSAPNVAPLQGKFKMHAAAFYVPLRVVWKDANAYFTGLKDVNLPHFPLQQLTAIYDVITDPVAKSDFQAYVTAMGLPFHKYVRTRGTTTGSTQNYRSLNASLLPFRCYRRIWWDWFRDPNVVPDSSESSYILNDNNNEAVNLYVQPHFATWSHSYISNTLRKPYTDQRTLGSIVGYDPTVDDVLGSQRVLRPSTASAHSPNSGTNVWDESDGYAGADVLNVNPAQFGTDDMVTRPFVNANVGTTTSSNLAYLSMANAMQSWLLKCNVLGGRLIDRLRGMFGSKVSPITLQMSEFLGTTEFDLTTEQMAAQGSTSTDGEGAITNAFGSTNPAQATIAGQSIGKSTMTKNGLGNIHYKVEEKGYFFILFWIMPDAMITEGLAPHWLRGVDGIAPSRFDFLTPEMVGTGFDPLYSYETFLPPSALTDTDKKNYDPFNALGWRGKYENYKYNKDMLSGCFTDPNTASSMKPWYLNRDVLFENGCTNALGQLESGVDGDTIVQNVNHDTLSQMRRDTRKAYDHVFVVSSPAYDHWVVQWNIDLKMVRPIGAINAPRIEMQSPVAIASSGSHL